MKQDILFLQPVFQHNIWGGTRLQDEYGYEINGNDIGECWGIAAHEHGDCIIREGSYQGIHLSELWRSHPELFGNIQERQFPLLVKIIDAKEDLSIQVHPDDAYAFEHEQGSLGKTECWYILDCDEEATLVVGHNAKSKEELQKLVEQARWKELIREVPIRKGDFIQIDPGTVHAIKGGILLLETQQNSDITYRVYDYDRMSHGNLRELHIEKSLDVICVPAKRAEESVLHAGDIPKNERYELVRCEYYTVSKIDVDGEFKQIQDAPFLLVSVIEGNGTINEKTIKKGDHFIVPCGYGEMIFKGNMQMIVSAV